MIKHSNLRFICVGAQKSGTTWLYARLNEIPQVQLPYQKELHYFDRSPKYLSPNILSSDRSPSINNLLEILSPLKCLNINKSFWYAKWHLGNISDSWYLSLFPNDKITGEITPSYSMLQKEDIRKMKFLLPNVKIILLLRDPIQRAWSHYKHYQRLANANAVPEMSPLDFLQHRRQTLRSDYIATIDRYTKVFSEGKVMIGFYDAIIHSPAELLIDICSHIGISNPHIREYCNLQEVTHPSSSQHIPPHCLSYLVEYYKEDIKILAQKYKSYCLDWEAKYYNSTTTNLKRPPTISL